MESKFFSKLFESRQMAHVFHLQSKSESGSYAEHKALQEYYDSVLDLVDSMIEVYQGQYGIVEGYDIIDTSISRESSPVAYFEDLANYLKSERYKAIKEDDSHLHNLVDEAIALVYKTIYKLKYLK